MVPPCSHAARAASAVCLAFVASTTARAGNRRKGRLSALRAHTSTKAPYKIDRHGKTRRNAKGA